MKFDPKVIHICPKSKKKTHSFIEYFNECILNESPINIGRYYSEEFDMNNVWNEANKRTYIKEI